MRLVGLLGVRLLSAHSPLGRWLASAFILLACGPVLLHAPLLRAAAPAFTIIDAPGAGSTTTGGSTGTGASGINNAGQMVGWFADARGDHGFMRAPSGKMIIIDMPGATDTRLNGVNDRG